MKPNSQIYVSIIVAILSFLARPSEGYVLTRCDNFRTDIKNGLADFLTSVSAARSSVTVEYHDNEVIDWFGLLDTLYPGLKTTPLLLNKLRSTLDYFHDFDDAEYASVADAQSNRDTPSVWVWWGPRDLQSLDSSTVFVCDPSIFERVDDYSTLWRDTTTGYLYLGPLSSEICPPGVKVVSAEHLARPMHFTVILCPEVLTQTPGQHKMFAGVDGLELSHTRNSEDANGNEDALDLFAWLDMSIDELRQHVLSVWMGRVIMYIQGRKFEKIVDNQGRTEGYLWIAYSPEYRTFGTAKTLPADRALDNIDSLSMYITGAGFYYNLLRNPNDRDNPIMTDPPRLYNLLRWTNQGTLYYAGIG